MTPASLALLPAAAPERVSWTQMLTGAIRPEFAVAVYVPDAGDRVLFGATCAVSGCPGRGAHHVKCDGYLCVSHTRQWRSDEQPAFDGWVRTGARPLQTLKLASRCGARSCPRSVYHHGLCYPHYGRWNLAGRPDRPEWARTAAPATVSKGARCRLPGCRFPSMGNFNFCDTHNLAFAQLRAEQPKSSPADFLVRAAKIKLSSAPRFDLRGVAPIVRLEMQYALQCRHDARRARLEPQAFRNATRWVAELGVESLMDRAGMFWEASARERFSWAARNSGCLELGWVRYVRARAQDLRDDYGGQDVWEWDTWTVERLHVDARYAHQPQRRIYFTGSGRWLSAGGAGGSPASRCRRPASPVPPTRCERSPAGWPASACCPRNRRS